MNADLTVNSYQKISDIQGGFAPNLAFEDYFAGSILNVGDQNSDGTNDIVVGALGHLNPTLGTNTGAFYMIELNSDGTVSEDLLYTYGEYCFSGELNSGDYFGGAITLLDSGPNPTKKLGCDPYFAFSLTNIILFTQNDDSYQFTINNHQCSIRYCHFERSREIYFNIAL
ncbi:hypothetical protein J0X14_05175 [Muricauda sp. CAU 1633]|uniref:integrin alpha n=1 Tax=Allomuricauda sp. CAU 1633 TaxID=2816036 RepID=UPI001A8ECF9A|nr:integrin alpha [Muricauda sp. CAU 1633]MBO0321677.1 hypothetical protein [Muricauda sp. CAU 1633]